MRRKKVLYRNLCLLLLFALFMTSCADSGFLEADSAEKETREEAGSQTGKEAGEGTKDQAQEKTRDQREDQTRDPTTTTREIYAMDTYMTLTIYGDAEVGQEAADQAEKEIYRLDALLSAQNSTGQLAEINAKGGGDVAGDLNTLVKRSLELWESTEGTFDIAIYPLVKAWGFDGGEHRVPTEEEIQELLPLVDAGKINYEEKETKSPGGTGIAGTSEALEADDSPAGEGRVQFGLEGMEMDFGGIAKGYTSARLMDIFQACGITSAMVNLGGNVQTLGSKPDGSLWRVAVKDPDNPENYLGILQVRDKAVVTSGGYERYFEENGKTYHHILDPATGYPADSGLVSATIVSADGTLADGLSTACFVMGLDKAESYWKSRRERGEDFDMILMTEDRKVYVTAGIAEDFTTDCDWEVVSG